jgi:hypothetical protein
MKRKSIKSTSKLDLVLLGLAYRELNKKEKVFPPCGTVFPTGPNFDRRTQKEAE